MKTVIVLLVFVLLITGCTSTITIKGECKDNSFNYSYQVDNTKCSNTITNNGFILRCNSE